jgi:hypothetical protein
MGINLGTLTPKDLFLGSLKPKAVYLGLNKVWPIVDPDAQAFLTAAAITDPTISDAINTLVLGLKSNNLWTKMVALYPFVGSTASNHKWNLKNPVDTNAAFRLTFFGGITHSSAGIIGNASNAYAQTHNTFSHYNSPSNAGLSFGFYTTTEHTFGVNRIPFGGGQHYIQWLALSPVNTRFAFRNILLDQTVTAPSDTIGYFAQSVDTNGTTRFYYNRTNTIQSAAITAGTSLTTANITLLTYQAGGAAVNSTMSTAYISNFLDSTDMVNLRTLIMNLNSTLGR